MLPSLKIVNIVSVPFSFFCQRLYPIFNNYAAPRDFGESLVFFSLWGEKPDDKNTGRFFFLGWINHFLIVIIDISGMNYATLSPTKCGRVSVLNVFFSFNLANAHFPLHSVLFSIHCYIINASIWFLQSI